MATNNPKREQSEKKDNSVLLHNEYVNKQMMSAGTIGKESDNTKKNKEFLQQRLVVATSLDCSPISSNYRNEASFEE